MSYRLPLLFGLAFGYIVGDYAWFGVLVMHDIKLIIKEFGGDGCTYGQLIQKLTDTGVKVSTVELSNALDILLTNNEVLCYNGVYKCKEQ